MERKELHPRNACIPIDDKLAGRFIEHKELHPSNTKSPTEDKFAGKLMVDKKLHPEKTALPISVRPEHAANAKSYEKGMTMRRISDTPEDIFAFPCDGTWLTYETFSDTKKLVVIILHI